MPANNDKNPWSNSRRVDMLHELLPKNYAGDVAEMINRETGSNLTKNAVIGKGHREGIVAGKRAPGIRPVKRRLTPRIRFRPVSIKIIAVEPSKPFSDDVPNMRPMGYHDDWPNNRCRYPYGEPRSADFYFCGAEGCDVIEGRSFCEFHSRLVYQPGRRAAYNAPFIFPLSVVGS